MSKSFVRTLKNKASGYTPTQVKVRNATRNEPSGPSVPELEELALLSHKRDELNELLHMLSQRLGDKGKNWRHVLKSLTVLDYLLRNGSEGAVLWTKDNIHLIRTLNQFEYVDDDGRDHGKNVREKAKELVELVSNESQLKQLRLATQDKRRALRPQKDSNRAQPSRQPAARGDDNDAELQLALEVSMQSALEEEERRKQLSNDDDDLKKAIQLSKQDDSKPSATVGVDLFGTPNIDHFSQQQQPGFKVDLFSSPQGQGQHPQHSTLTSGYSAENGQNTFSTSNVISSQPQQQQFSSPSQLPYGHQQQLDLFGNAPVQSHFTGSNNPFNQNTATSPPATSNLPLTRALDSPSHKQAFFNEPVAVTTQSINLFAPTTTASVSQPFFANTTSSAPATSLFSSPSTSTQPSTFANVNSLNSLFDLPATTQANSFFAQSPTTSAAPVQHSSSLFDRPATSHPFAQSATPAFAGSQSPFASPVPASQAMFNPPLPPKQAITSTGNNLFGAPTAHAGYSNPAFSPTTTGAYDYNGNVNVSTPFSTNNTFQNTNSHNPFMAPTSPTIPTTHAGYNNYVQAAPTGYGFGNVPSSPQQRHKQQPQQSLIDL